MTATNLDALIAAADLTDRADRLMLADAMAEAGRDGEASLLRRAEQVAIVAGVLRESMTLGEFGCRAERPVACSFDVHSNAEYFALDQEILLSDPGIIDLPGYLTDGGSWEWLGGEPDGRGFGELPRIGGRAIHSLSASDDADHYASLTENT